MTQSITRRPAAAHIPLADPHSLGQSQPSVRFDAWVRKDASGLGCSVQCNQWWGHSGKAGLRPCVCTAGP